jgi:RHS repeat-associated protein
MSAGLTPARKPHPLTPHPEKSQSKLGSRGVGAEATPETSNDNVLIFGLGDTSGDDATASEPVTNLESILEDDGYSVTVDSSSTLPSDISSYGSIWNVDIQDPITSDDAATLESFVESGGGLFLTGERPCCEVGPVNAEDQSIINSLVASGGVGVGDLGDATNGDDDPQNDPVNESAPDGVATYPNSLSTWNPSAPGGISGISSSNTFASTSFTSGTGAVGAVWDGSSLVGGGEGRLAILMDINWLESAYWQETDAEQVAHNLEAFLSGEGSVSVVGVEAGSAYATGHISKLPPGCNHGKRPVNCGSGDFWHTFTDASVPGVGPSLDLTRTYNSLNASTEGIFGYGWSSSYDINLMMNGDGSVTFVDDDGSQVTAEPDGSGGFTLPSWADSSLTYSSGIYTFVQHQTTTYTFNSSGQLTSITDPNGDSTAFSYALGRLSTVTDPASRTLSFGYGTNGLVSSVTDPMGRETTYDYDSSDNLTSVTDPLSRVTSFTYDTGGDHLLLTMTLPNGQSGASDAGDTTVNTYDSTGRVLTQTDPKGQETTFAYAGNNFSGGGGSTTITDPDGNAEVQHYINGELMSDAKGTSTSSFAYDPATFGRTSTTNPDGETSSATYDANGNQLTSTDALDDVTSYSYNSFNEPTCKATPESASACSALSPPSAITGGGTITPPSSAPPAHVTYTQYDTDGNKIWTTTGVYASGSGSAGYSQTSYDLYNGESVTLGGTSHSCTTSAPSTSLPCATISPNGVVTQLAYNSQGDLTSSATPDGNSGGEVATTSHSYDTDGEETSTVAPDGNLSGANTGNYTSTKTYNADGEVTKVAVGDGSGATVVPRVTTYSYDADGNRTATTQSSSIRRIGSSSGANSGSSLALTLPKGIRSGDEAILSTTTGGSGSAPTLQHYTANDIYQIAGVGSGGEGPSGTQAIETGLYNPSATATDSAGDVYVSNFNNSSVEEIAATTHTQWGQSMIAGDAYVVAGSPTGDDGSTGDGGPATSALLNTPSGLAVDGAGDLYIADPGNSRIQEIPAASGTQWGQSMTAGDIYTVAGDSSGSSGNTGDGGAATSALLNGSDGLGVGVDAAGDLYIADGGNNRIREVAVVSGTQWGQSMTAGDIYAVAGDPSGSWGTDGDGGAATSAELGAPSGVAIDSSGDLYIADAGNNRIQEVAVASGTQWGQSMTAGDIYTVAGDTSGTSGDSGDGGAATSAELSFPYGVAVDSAGNLYIADSGNNRVQEVPVVTGSHRGQSMTANDIYTVAGDSSGSSGDGGDGGSATSATLSAPYGIALDSSGDIYIPDGNNNALRMVAHDDESRYPGTAGVAYIVAGNDNNSGTPTGNGGPAAPNAGLSDPSSAVVDGSGDLYIADVGNNRVQEVPATSGTHWGQSMIAGYTYTIAGDAGGSSGSSGDGGAATSAELNYPAAIALDAAGDLYIADGGNNRIQEVPVSSGTQWGQSMTADDIYTAAGDSSGSSGSSGDGGAATSAGLNYPDGLAFDGTGDLYIADNSNNRVQEVPATSSTQWGQSMTADDIYTVAGGSGGTSGDEGAATSAQLSGPAGIDVDGSGNLYIADQGNSRVQEVAAYDGTQRGQSMTADDMYTVAGDSDGTGGDSGLGGAATSAELAAVASVTVDSSGNLYLSDRNNGLVDEVPATTGTQWSQSMTADDLYAVAGGGSGGDGETATDVGLSLPEDVAVDSSGNLFIADSANDRIREVDSASGTPQTVTTPTGWTLQSTESSGATTTDVYTRTLAASDTGVTLNYSTAASKVASLAVYRGADSSSPIDVSSVGATSSGTSVAAASLTTTDPGDKLVFVGGGSGQGSSPTWTAPSGMATVAGTDTGGVSDVMAAGPGPNPAGATGSTSATTSDAGVLTAIELALSPGTVTAATAYDSDDEATLATDPDGNASLTCYDGDGNVDETVPPAGVAADSLSPASCPTSYGDRLATDATTYAYDALGDKTVVTTPAPAGLTGYETTTNAYDAAGRLTSTTAPPTSTAGGADDDVTTYTYNVAGELLATAAGVGSDIVTHTSYCYDPDGNKTASVAPDGYVAPPRLSVAKKGSITLDAIETVSITSCSGSFPYQTSSPYQTGYEYDSAGELVSQTAPATTWAADGQTTTYSYDADGNQLTSEDPNGVTTTNTYTPLDQLSGTSYSGSSAPSVTDTYDADGNRTQMTDGTGTSTSTYDPFGELTASENGAGTTTDYAYDALGNVAAITYPLGGGATWAPTDTVTYDYDAASQMTSVTDFGGHTTTVTNTADGLPSTLGLGDTGDTLTTSYDPTDAPSDIALTDASSTTLASYGYSDEPSGGVATETDTPSGASTPSDYTYDAQSRLTQMTPGSGAALSYGEDASSNLTTLPTGATASYDDASELTSSVLSGTTTDYTYDADGNRTEATVAGTTTTAAYNGASQLTGYSNSAADMTTASYDGEGVRASAASTPSGEGSTTQHFVWNENGSIPQLLMDSTNAYLYGPGSTPIEQVNLSSGTIKYLVSDALGSVRGIVNSSGSLTHSTTYDAWGNPETTGGLASETPIGFTGGYTDPSGLLYLINRYYDPTTGQFLNVDPLVAATEAPYFYAGDDPVRTTDLSGLCNSNPLSGSFWTQGNCIAGAVGGPRGGGGESAGGVLKSVGILAATDVIVVYGGAYAIGVGSSFLGAAGTGAVAAEAEAAEGSLLSISYPSDVLMVGLTVVPTALGPPALAFGSLWWLTHATASAMPKPDQIGCK